MSDEKNQVSPSASAPGGDAAAKGSDAGGGGVRAEDRVEHAVWLAGAYEQVARTVPLGQAVRGGPFDGVPMFDLYMTHARVVRAALRLGDESPPLLSAASRVPVASPTVAEPPVATEPPGTESLAKSASEPTAQPQD